MKKITYFNKLILMTITFLFLSFFSNSCKNFYAQASNKELTAMINNKKVVLEVADTDLLREKGLMRRNTLKENSGMIFLFDYPDYVNFWMKNVKIPLDILFINGDKIVNIYKEASVCKKEPCRIYPSKFKINK
ncbi:MAG: DUF192 domain-containing protein [bacterium]